MGVRNIQQEEQGTRFEPVLIRHMLLARILFPLAAFFFLVLTLSVCHMLFGHVGDDWPMMQQILIRNLLLLGLPASLTFCFAFLSYVVFREFWILDAVSLTQHGLFRTRKIVWSEVLSLNWKPVSGVILLRSKNCRIPLFVDSMSSQLHLKVVHHLHTSIPTEKQHHWQNFQRRVFASLGQPPLPQEHA